MTGRRAHRAAEQRRRKATAAATVVAVTMAARVACRGWLVWIWMRLFVYRPKKMSCCKMTQVGESGWGWVAFRVVLGLGWVWAG